MDRTMEKGISDIVGVFTDPILVFPGGWGDTLPDWFKEAITLERLIANMKALKGEEMTGTDCEACAYLYTVSLTQPMDYDWVQIYLYLATKEMRQVKQVEVPADIAVQKLNDEQQRDLDRLKRWIYEGRIKVRGERDRTERRHRKEEEVAQKKIEQPALFDL
jgi:hypothetical protein